MLRTILLCLALGFPGAALAEEFPYSALGLEIRSDDGTVMSRVEAVERDASGRVVSIEAPGLAPEDAPAASEDLLAERDDGHFFISYRTAQGHDRARPTGGGILNAAR